MPGATGEDHKQQAYFRGRLLHQKQVQHWHVGGYPIVPPILFFLHLGNNEENSRHNSKPGALHLEGACPADIFLLSLMQIQQLC